MSLLALKILYEDNHLLVVNKPAGVLCQGDASGDATLIEAARSYLKTRYGKPGNVYIGLVHRLDRPVAGVLVLARTSKAAGRLSAAFREGRVKKTYRAVVIGSPPNDQGRLEDWLRKVSRQRRSQVAAPHSEGARRASLDYCVIARRSGSSLLEVTLHTGRSHQIRVQLAAMGHPILGDLKYGAETPLPGGAVALYAWRLGFEHPTRREALDILAPPPAGWPWPEV